MAAAIRNKGNVQDFSTESSLVECFVGTLQAGRTTFGAVQVTTEWNYRSGLVDILARDKAQELVAFEAKLADWRRAFLQAYRNTAYANKAYVLMPEKTAHRALCDQEEFEFRGIGLCSFNGKELRILIEAAEQDPLLQWLRVRAHEHFNSLPDERRSRLNRGRSRAVQTAQL